MRDFAPCGLTVERALAGDDDGPLHGGPGTDKLPDGRRARNELRSPDEQGVPGPPCSPRPRRHRVRTDQLSKAGQSRFQLHDLLREIHRRNVAYVDTNKPENILLGDDGRPYLIDFQISWDLDSLLGNNPLTRWWLRTCQREE